MFVFVFFGSEILIFDSGGFQIRRNVCRRNVLAGTCLPKRMPPEHACRNVCRRNVLAGTYPPEHANAFPPEHDVFSLQYKSLAWRRIWGLRLAEIGHAPCGVRICTLRQVFEYSPQSTRVLAAKYAGALRIPPRRLGHGRDAARPRHGGQGRILINSRYMMRFGAVIPPFRVVNPALSLKKVNAARFLT